MIRREGIILWAALILSITIHLFVLLPGLVQASSSDGAIEEEEQLVNESRFKPPQEEDDPVKLGIEESDASTLTWIGYKEYQEHLARLAEVEQAELQAGAALPPAGGAPAAPNVPQVTPQPPAPPTPADPSDPSEPRPETAPLPAEDQQIASNATPAETPPAPAAGPTATTPADTPPPPGGLPQRDGGLALPGTDTTPVDGQKTPTPESQLPESDQPEKTPPVTQPQDSPDPASKQPQPKPTAPPEASQPEKKPPTKPETPSPPTPPTPPSTPGPGGTQGDAPPGENAPPAREETAEDLPPTPNASRSDSSASSTIKVPRKDWLSGRPIAAHGLQLRPRRPKFTALQKITSSGGQTMLVRMDFGSNGKPAFASILRGSGNPVLDKNVLASLYQWRASGQRLRKLEKGQRIPVQLEIILSVN